MNKWFQILFRATHNSSYFQCKLFHEWYFFFFRAHRSPIRLQRGFDDLRQESLMYSWLGRICLFPYTKIVESRRCIDEEGILSFFYGLWISMKKWKKIEKDIGKRVITITHNFTREIEIDFLFCTQNSILSIFLTRQIQVLSIYNPANSIFKHF